MLSFDTNLAVHAANCDSASHAQSRGFIESLAARGKIWIRVSPHHRRAVGTDAASSRRDGICNGKRQGLCKAGIRTGLESSYDLTIQPVIPLSNTVRAASSHEHSLTRTGSGFAEGVC